MDLHDLALVGAALYWGEGTKARKLKRGGMIYAIEFTNVDPSMVAVFMSFLRRIIGVDETRIRLQMFIYPDHDENELKEFWSSLLKLPASSFQKTIMLKQTSGRFRPSEYGIMKIRYSHKEHFLKLQGIIADVKGGVG